MANARCYNGLSHRFNTYLLVATEQFHLALETAAKHKLTIATKRTRGAVEQSGLLALATAVGTVISGFGGTLSEYAITHYLEH